MEYDENVYPTEPDEPTNITLKGKSRAFVNAVIKCKEIFKRGASKEMNGAKAKVLDLRNKKAIEVILEVIDEKGRGNASVEIFGPNQKTNQCSIVKKKIK